MSESPVRTHPLVIIAATTVIIACLVAIAVMTGIVPGPSAKTDKPAEQSTPYLPPAANVQAPGAQNQTATENRLTADTPRQQSAPRAAERAAQRFPEQRVERNVARAPERSAVGSTNEPAPSRSVAAAERPAPRPVCTNCGTVTSVRAVTEQGEASLIGPIAGGALGGAIGSQIGGGSGRTLATIAGAAGGAAIGTEVERRSKAQTTYVVAVRMNDGTTRTINYQSPPGYEAGDRVRVVDGRLVRD